MEDKYDIKEIFSKKIRAGRRTYFFDVRSTKAEDYFMTITESIKTMNEEGVPSYRKHKIYLYKEDFKEFQKTFEEVSKFIISEKGEEIISYKKIDKKEDSSNNFTEVNFDDLGND